MKYADRRRIDVSKYVEKKSNLSYLSWAWAVDQLMLADESATWEYGEPRTFGGGTVMVFCTVTAFGQSRTAQLPVMDHRNKAIADPDAFAMNTAMQRCLAKAIALHGIGLYIYNGEDLPPDFRPEDAVPAERREAIQAQIDAAGDDVALRKAFKALDEAERTAMMDAFTARAAALKEAA